MSKPRPNRVPPCPLQVNFDNERFLEYSIEADRLTEGLRKQVLAKDPSAAPQVPDNTPWFDRTGHPYAFSISGALGSSNPPTLDDMIELGNRASFSHRRTLYKGECGSWCPFPSPGPES